MKQRLAVLIIAPLLFLAAVAPAYAQCDKEIALYGYSTETAGKQSFGTIVAAAGDVNNDGHNDFMIATTKGTFNLEASAVVFSGLNGDSIRTYYYNNNTIYGASGFGDYNHDNYDDVLVNGVVYSGLNGDTLHEFPLGGRDGVSGGDVND